jgi:Phosphate-selective porin O and P
MKTDMLEGRPIQMFSRWRLTSAYLCLIYLAAIGPVLAQNLPAQPSTVPAPQQQRVDRPSSVDVEELKARVKALEDLAKRGSPAPGHPAIPPKNFSESLSDVEDTLDLLNEKIGDLSKKLENRVIMNLYVTGAFESFQHKDSIFDARNVELLGTGHITSRLKAFTEIEFERTAMTSQSIGTATRRQGEVEVEQGWLEYSITETFKPRVGVILVPFGRLNLEHFDPIQDLTDRPIAMRRVIPTTWGEAGMGFTGRASMNNSLLREMSVDYQVYAINGLTNAITDTGTRNARGGFAADNNANKAVVGRLGVQLYPGGELGLSGYRGTIDRLGHHMTGVDVDWKFRWGPLELLGEYAYFGVDRGALQFGSTTITVPRTLQGGYAQANYYFWPEFLRGSFLSRNFEDPQFTAIFRYDFARVADDEDAGTVANKEERWTIGMNYRPVKSFVFKVEYQFNKTRSEALERGTANGMVMSVTGAF